MNNIFGKLFGLNYVRKQHLKNTRSEEMKAFYSRPFPHKNSPLNNIEIVSIDFETSGLDMAKDCVVSIGLVEIASMGIKLQTAYHQLIASDIKLPEQSVVIHQITDNKLAEGDDIGSVLPQVLERLSGKVLLAHNAKVEMGFLNKMCMELYDTRFVMPVIDTQFLAKRSLERKNTSYKGAELRLFNLRDAFEMPAFRAHDALMDAIATAELFLALASKISPKSNARLKEFLI